MCTILPIYNNNQPWPANFLQQISGIQSFSESNYLYELTMNNAIPNHIVIGYILKCESVTNQVYSLVRSEALLSNKLTNTNVFIVQLCHMAYGEGGMMEVERNSNCNCKYILYIILHNITTDWQQINMISIFWFAICLCLCLLYVTQLIILLAFKFCIQIN